MATSYVFTRKPKEDKLSVLHLGKHLVTTTKWNDEVIQEFASDDAAQTHIDRFVALRKRGGYAVRAIEQTPESSILPHQLSSDPLAKFVHWVKKPPRRLEVKLHRWQSRETIAAIVDRIDKEKPPTLGGHFSLKSAQNTHFVREFIGRSLPAIHSLIFSQGHTLLLDQHDLHYGSLAYVFAAMPRLQRVFLNGDLAFRPFQHDSLVELHMQGDPMRIATVKALGACSLPALQKLGVRLCHAMPCECRIDMVAIALSTLAAPCLEWIRVQGIPDIAHFLEVLLGRGLPSSMHTLWLEGEILDEDVLLEVLQRHADVLRNLRHFSLPLMDEVSSCAVDRVRELVPNYVDKSNEMGIFGPHPFDTW